MAATVRGVMQGIGGPAYAPAIVGQALLEMQAAGTPFTANALRAFCRRLEAALRPELAPGVAGSPRAQRHHAAISDFLVKHTPNGDIPDGLE